MEWTEGFLTGGQTTVKWSDPHLVVLVRVQVDLGVAQGARERLRRADLGPPLEFHRPEPGMIRGAHGLNIDPKLSTGQPSAIIDETDL